MDYPFPSPHLEMIKPSLIRTVAALRNEDTLDLGLGEPDLPLPPLLLQNAFQQLQKMFKVGSSILTSLST